MTEYSLKYKISTLFNGKKWVDKSYHYANSTLLKSNTCDSS